jgi:hypothetical protein
MSRLPIRAAVFALLALVAIGLISAVALLIIVGLPDPGTGTAGFTTAAAGVAQRVDLVVGAIVMLFLGWLTARPFVGRQALIAAAVFAALYLVIDMVVVALIGRSGPFNAATLLPYGTKLVAALLGGLLASRRRAAA